MVKNHKNKNNSSTRTKQKAYGNEGASTGIVSETSQMRLTRGKSKRDLVDLDDQNRAEQPLPKTKKNFNYG